MLYAYGSLAFPYAAAFVALQVIVPTWYAGSAALSLSAVGALVLAARLVDTLTDPLVGAWSDRATARYGRRKSFVIGALPLVAVSVWQLFVPPADAGAAHLLGWSIALYVGGTAALVPMSAWAAELSTDYHVRSRIAGIRVGFALTGTLVALLLAAATTNGATESVAAVGEATAAATGAARESLGDALRAIASLVLVTLVLTTAWAAWRVPDDAPRGRSARPFEGVRELVLVANPFRQLLAAFFLNALGSAIPATLFLLYVTWVLDAESSVGPMLFVYFGAAALSVPCWIALAKRLGKHATWRIGIVLACTFFSAAPFLGADDVALFWVVVVVTGFATGADLCLPQAMNADVIEWDTLESGQHRPGIFFALWGTASKLSYALAIGVAFPLLELGGFDAKGGGDLEALRWLAVLYGAPCIGFKIAALVVMRRYPIDEAVHDGIRQRLAGHDAS